MNLLDAAVKLKQLVNKASQTSDEAKTVFEVNFIELEIIILSI